MTTIKRIIYKEMKRKRGVFTFLKKFSGYVL